MIPLGEEGAGRVSAVRWVVARQAPVARAAPDGPSPGLACAGCTQATGRTRRLTKKRHLMPHRGDAGPPRGVRPPLVSRTRHPMLRARRSGRAPCPAAVACVRLMHMPPPEGDVPEAGQRRVSAVGQRGESAAGQLVPPGTAADRRQTTICLAAVSGRPCAVTTGSSGWYPPQSTISQAILPSMTS